MKNKTTQIIVSTIVVILVVVALGILLNKPKAIGKYGPLAQCITDSGTKFYGAFWCSHCQNQKALFGGAKDLLPYVECALPLEEQKLADIEIQKAKAEGRLKEGENPETIGIKTRQDICKEKDIKSFPTWIFTDSSILTGEVSLETLALKTSCVLPE